jgi:hypothetical protein
MADLYVSDSTFSAFVEAYGSDAKDEMRSVLKANAPEVDDAG